MELTKNEYFPDYEYILSEGEKVYDHIKIHCFEQLESAMVLVRGIPVKAAKISDVLANAVSLERLAEFLGLDTSEIS